MGASLDQIQKRRLLSSYFSVVISVFLVLFLLGALALFVINSNRLSNEFKEEIAMSLYFKNTVSQTEIDIFTEVLKNKKYVKDYNFISKEAAAKAHTDIIGEDFMKFLGYNPLQNSIDIHLKNEFMNTQSILAIEKELRENPKIDDIIYDKELVDMVNQNLSKISYWILVVSGFFAFISVLLINSSMRLSIYSKRFIIKTMQLVGATKSFIRKPFIWQSIKLGVIGAFLAILSLTLLLLYIDNAMPNLGIMKDTSIIAMVMGGVLLFGILITWFSTFFATQRFLNLRTSDLY